MLLMIDNYDSFTYNLVQLFQSLGQEVEVYLNNRITTEEILKKRPSGIILSPGPCTPAESGVCPEVVRKLHPHIPILGVCLGHQVIGEIFGARVAGAGRIMHGKTDGITHGEDPLFRRIPREFTATRYHSLCVHDIENAPELIPIAYSVTDGTLMALRHRQFPVYGVQFHPESYASEYGLELGQNFLDLT